MSKFHLANAAGTKTNGHIGYLNNLARKGWLSKQPADFQRTIATLGRWVSVQAGTRIYSAGDPSDALVGIDQGNLDVLVSVSADEECAFYRGGVGEWFGDGGLLFGEPRQLSLEAATQTRIFLVPQTSLRQQLARNPIEWRYMFHLATNRIMVKADVVGDLLSLHPRARVARQLLRMYEKDGSVNATQEDLGKLVGMSRATFRRSIEQLVASGAIKVSYGKLTIADLASVRHAADLSPVDAV